MSLGVCKRLINRYFYYKEDSKRLKDKRQKNKNKEWQKSVSLVFSFFCLFFPQGVYQ